MRKSIEKIAEDKAMAAAVRAFALAMLGRISTREAAEAVVKAIAPALGRGETDHGQQKQQKAEEKGQECDRYDAAEKRQTQKAKRSRLGHIDAADAKLFEAPARIFRLNAAASPWR
jgi:hypothetical protein